MGTVQYMPPEELSAPGSSEDGSTAWDVFSLGRTICELAVERRPFASLSPKAGSCLWLSAVQLAAPRKATVCSRLMRSLPLAELNAQPPYQAVIAAVTGANGETRSQPRVSLEELDEAGFEESAKPV